MPAVEVNNLKKKFEDEEILRDVSFSVEEGEVFGVLGPNGAGKSTTINILTTLLTPTSGTASVAGYDILQNTNEVRKRIGWCTAATKFIWTFDSRQILNYYGMLYGLDSGRLARKREELIEFFEISEFANKRFYTLSTGMKQKVALAKSLMNNPEVWFLDEPTNGLDVEVSKEIRKKIKQVVHEQGTTVILTSHYLNEVEEMCKRIALLNKGEVVVVGNVREIKDSLNFFDNIHFTLEKEHNLDFLQDISGVELLRVEGTKILIRTGQPQKVIGKIIDALEAKGIKFHDLEVKRATLEDAFFKLIKRAKEQVKG